MKIEILEKANELEARAKDLNYEEEKLTWIYRDNRTLLINDGNHAINLKTIDPSGELQKTVLLLVEAKLANAKSQVDKEFEAL